MRGVGRSGDYQINTRKWLSGMMLIQGWERIEVDILKMLRGEALEIYFTECYHMFQLEQKQLLNAPSWIFETGVFIVALAVLETTLWTRLALTSETGLPCFPSAGIKGIHHHHPACCDFLWTMVPLRGCQNGSSQRLLNLRRVFFFYLSGWLVFFSLPGW